MKTALTRTLSVSKNVKADKDLLFQPSMFYSSQKKRFTCHRLTGKPTNYSNNFKKWAQVSSCDDIALGLVILC